MTPTENPTPKNRRIDFKQSIAYLLHPRQGIAWLAGQEKPVWLTPMLVLSLTFLLYTIVNGILRARAAAMGEISLPADWEWWTPEMQNNYMQAMQATQGPAFLFVIPSVLGLSKLWLGWLIVSGMLHLVSTLLGGRGRMTSALNVVAFASLPFAVRDLLRVLYSLIAGHGVVSPGLSGFASAAFLSQLLGNLDLFLIWHAILLVFGIRAVDTLPLKKAAIGVVLLLLVILLVQSGLGALTANLGGMMVYRPFF
jgi:hypothetical protein